eukprot:CFRG5495T1
MDSYKRRRSPVRDFEDDDNKCGGNTENNIVDNNKRAFGIVTRSRKTLDRVQQLRERDAKERIDPAELSSEVDFTTSSALTDSLDAKLGLDSDAVPSAESTPKSTQPRTPSLKRSPLNGPTTPWSTKSSTSMSTPSTSWSANNKKARLSPLSKPWSANGRVLPLSRKSNLSPQPGERKNGLTNKAVP